MKKMFLFVVAIAASLNLMALTPTATAMITVTGDVSGNFDRVTLVESTTDGFTSGYENGYDVFQPELNIPGLYAISGANRFSTSMTNNLDNNALGLITGTDVSYTMTFSGVSGRTLKLYDRVTGIETTIENAGSYQFSATAEKRIDNRFVINFEASAFEFKVCHIGDEVTIENNPYEGNTVITDANDVAHEYDSSLTSIDVSTLPEGRATLKIGNHTYVIIIKH